MNYITEVIKIAGLQPTARKCNVSHQAVRKWEAAHTLPRTDYTGETTYAKKLAALTGNKVKAKQLLSMKRKKT